MLMQLPKELVKKEKVFTSIEEVFQEHRGENKTSISIVYDSTMTKATLVISPSIEISEENLHEFKNHTREIGYKIIRKIGYDGQGIGHIIQGILSPNLVIPRAKHEGL
jgi:hypothetical protein